LYGCDGSGYDVDIDFEFDPAHAHGVLDAILFVHHKFLWNYMDDLPVRRDGNGFGLVDHPFDVLSSDFPIFAGYGDHAPAVKALDMGTGNSDKAGIDLHPGHQFRFFLSLFDGFYGGLQVDDYAFPEAFGIGCSDPDDLDLSIFRDLSNDGGHFLVPISNPTM